MSDAAQTLLEAYLRYRPDLLRHFTARLKSAAAAEDLVQDIYVRLRAHPAPERLENAAAYLFRMGSNLLVDNVRSELRSAARDTAWRDSHVTLSGRDPVADQPAADEALAARQRLAALERALADLPPETARIFRLHKFEDLPYGEVARRLNISKSKVEKHMMAALRKLAAAIR